MKHHIEKYGRRFPLWVLAELFTFGMLSRFFADLKTPDQKAIARQYGVTSKMLASWLRCCTDFRNNCAHHGRLYFRLFPASPAGSFDTTEKEKRQLFVMLQVLEKLYPVKKAWRDEVIKPLGELIEEYKGDIILSHIGFPDNWREKMIAKQSPP